MMKVKFFMWCIILSLTTLQKVVAQDIHFSQIHASPMYLNPGMTGLINSDFRLISNTKSQWQLFDKGYQTSLASAEGKINRGFSYNDDFGIGLQITGDQAGDLNFTTTEVALSFSYLKAINREGDHLISIGVKYGWNRQYFDLSSVRLFDLDPLFSQGDFVPQINYGDLSLGVGWFMPYGRKNNFYLGASIFHLNKYNLSFDQSGGVLPSAAFKKVVLLAGGIHRFSPYLSILPSVTWANQGPHNEFSGGTFLKLTREVFSIYQTDMAMYAGLWFRSSLPAFQPQRDALIASFRLDYNQFQFTFSWDFTLSELGLANYAAGGPELSIIYQIKRNPQKVNRVICPDI
jgi:type IX secretion system PorP/SprF family membrane protein